MSFSWLTFHTVGFRVDMIRPPLRLFTFLSAHQCRCFYSPLKDKHTNKHKITQTSTHLISVPRFYYVELSRVLPDFLASYARTVYAVAVSFPRHFLPLLFRNKTEADGHLASQNFRFLNCVLLHTSSNEPQAEAYVKLFKSKNPGNSQTQLLKY